MEKYFTIYWLSGNKNIVKGNTLEEAYSKRWDGGAFLIADGYVEGMSNDYYWTGREWENKTTFGIDFESIDDKVFADPENILDRYKYVEIKYENGNILVLREDYGSFAGIGWVHYISVSCGEFTEDPYDAVFDQGGPSGPAYTMNQTEYFLPTNKDVAFADFIKRAKSENPIKALGEHSVSLEEIAATNQQFN